MGHKRSIGRRRLLSGGDDGAAPYANKRVLVSSRGDELYTALLKESRTTVALEPEERQSTALRGARSVP
jgi:hypothetical protein